MKYKPEVERVMAGESMNSVAKSIGVNINTLRREVIKHPGFATAKSSGVIRQSGVFDKPKREIADHADAIAEVVSGATTTATAAKYGIPVASLNKLVKRAHPNFSFQHRGMTQEEVLKMQMNKLKDKMLAASTRGPQQHQ